ncbi:class I SAM-dependent methyltransferase [Nonomuraea sp. NPDC049625]|uniref:class I SAM-dependent methyltransferase n=1 Tax=Nonomuraea sp. NPDC049625 TaxID=3155775 RepID=UPI0034492819
MTYLSPLGYLLGLEGVALLRAFREGRSDRAFVRARIAEVRALLDAPALADADGVTAEVGAIGSREVYRTWAPHYDAGGNQMIDSEQPVVRRILDGLPVGIALDAACGTGRHAAYLAELGHRVIGVDTSPEMLAQARRRPEADVSPARSRWGPEADVSPARSRWGSEADISAERSGQVVRGLPAVGLAMGDLHRLPLPDDAVDTVVCALALVHVPDLAPVLAEFARVLRTGGHLIITDPHPMATYLAPAAPSPGPDGSPALPADRPRSLSDYLAAALPLGFQVRHCEEPRRPPLPLVPGTRPPDPLPPQGSYEIMYWCPEAADAAMSGMPVAVVWHFQLSPRP